MNTQPTQSACAICEKTFAEALTDGTSGNWGIQWTGPHSARVSAETCSDACDAEFDRRHRDPVTRKTTDLATALRRG